MKKVIELIEGNDIEGAAGVIADSKNKDIIKYREEYNNDRKQREGQVGRREDKATKDNPINVAKIPIPFQKKICKSSAYFLFGSPVKITPREIDENEQSNVLVDVWKELRMDSLLLKLCESVKSQTEGAIIFYPVTKNEGKDNVIKARVLDNSTGSLHPVFDAYGEMKAFGWSFTSKEGDKDIEYMYLFTAEKEYQLKNSEGWKIEKEEENLFKKIPVVYVNQEQPEWWDVKELIDRYEMSFSKFCDTNDYFASPKYKATGKLTQSVADSKVVELDVIETDKGTILQSDLEVISWDRAPEALKLEFETNKALIHEMTDTPDLSFDNVKGLGTVSGISLKMMFMGPMLKAKWHQGDYQVAISRMINIIKAGILYVTKEVSGDSFLESNYDVTFTSILPENLKETIEILSEAMGGDKILSLKSALEHNPLVSNTTDEIDQIKKEEEKSLGATTNLEE